MLAAPSRQRIRRRDGEIRRARRSFGGPMARTTDQPNWSRSRSRRDSAPARNPAVRTNAGGMSDRSRCSGPRPSTNPWGHHGRTDSGYSARSTCCIFSGRTKARPRALPRLVQRRHQAVSTATAAGVGAERGEEGTQRGAEDHARAEPGPARLPTSGASRTMQMEVRGRPRAFVRTATSRTSAQPTLFAEWDRRRLCGSLRPPSRPDYAAADVLRSAPALVTTSSPVF